MQAVSFISLPLYCSKQYCYLWGLKIHVAHINCNNTNHCNNLPAIWHGNLTVTTIAPTIAATTTTAATTATMAITVLVLMPLEAGDSVVGSPPYLTVGSAVDADDAFSAMALLVPVGVQLRLRSPFVAYMQRERLDKQSQVN